MCVVPIFVFVFGIVKLKNSVSLIISSERHVADDFLFE
jgi:hypothetical protein